MSVLNIRKAQREGARVLIGIAGISGSGKTYTAIKLAYGLAGGNGKKVGFLDTENKRGSLYADIVDDPFLIGDLYAPFSPGRYIDAIREFQEAGVEVLVIDSISHEWEGTGGCEEIANAHNKRVLGWQKAKAEHKRFMNVLLQSNLHIIACIRARDKVDFSDSNNPKPLGVQPICEKNFMFEMTASLMMHDQGSRQSVLKCPADLTGILGRQTDYISEQDGVALREWIAGGKRVDANLERHKNALQAASEAGLEALKAAWTTVPPNYQKKLGKDFLDQMKAAAQAFDDAAKKQVDVPALVDALNAEEDPL
jgi:AAA domain